MSAVVASRRMTVAQALVRFLAVQEVERDGRRRRFFGGCRGILGHGNVAGLGQALQQHEGVLPFRQARNEQSMVHLAVGYARQLDRLGALACTSSVGPGATNMVTGAALATVNRLPVLLLPGDTFATRGPHPVLQQLERADDGTVSVNDALRPVSAYFDRVERPEQLFAAALEAMRVLTDPAATGAVTLALPEDVQTEALAVPSGFLAPRVWRVDRQPPDPAAPAAAAAAVRSARRPLVVAGGGVAYSGAEAALAAFAAERGVPVCETQAGRGALADEHPLGLGAVGATGTEAANRIAARADLVIAIGTRMTDFTTASRSVFADPGVRYLALNVSRLDAVKHGALPLRADARAGLEALAAELGGWRAEAAWTARAETELAAWRERRDAHLSAARAIGNGGGPVPQAAIVAAVNDAAGTDGTVVCAAGSLPGELHRLWRSHDRKGYHVEYGYSCMGYEIPAGIGIKLASPERRVLVMVGDGSFLMSPSELATAALEGIDLTVVLVDNGGFASIGALSRSLGQRGWGTISRLSADGGQRLDPAREVAEEEPPLELAAVARGLGAAVLEAGGEAELRSALAEAGEIAGPVVVAVRGARRADPVPGGAWWQVPVAETSAMPAVNAARQRFERDLRTVNDPRRPS